MIIKAYRFRLEPKQRHRATLQASADCCRFVWNWALQQRNDTWQAVKDLPPERRSEALHECTQAKQSQQLPHLKCQFPFLAVAPAGALQQVLLDLERAWQGFFDKRTMHPRYHRKGDNDAFRESDSKKISVNAQAIRLPKVGWINYTNSRGKWWRSAIIRQATVVRDGHEWFVAIIVGVEPEQIIPKSNSAVGIDLGVTQALTIVTDVEDNLVYHLPTASAGERRHLRTLQRRLSRTQRGSCNRDKAMKRFGKFTRRIKNRVHNSLHKITTFMAKNHGCVAIEDLRVQEMTTSARGTEKLPGKNFSAKAGLNRAIREHCWGETRRQFVYKCSWYGSDLQVVPAAYTSQKCSKCGHVSSQNRTSRDIFRCVVCGHTENADVNAGRNILRAGLALSACGASSGGVEPGTHSGAPPQGDLAGSPDHLRSGGCQRKPNQEFSARVS